MLFINPASTNAKASVAAAAIPLELGWSKAAPDVTTQGRGHITVRGLTLGGTHPPPPPGFENSPAAARVLEDKSR